MADVNERRFPNIEQERGHWQRLADFWEFEANEARRFSGDDNEATAKSFANGARTARDMAAHYAAILIGGK
jgi:hypothetical protein